MAERSSGNQKEQYVSKAKRAEYAGGMPKPKADVRVASNDRKGKEANALANLMANAEIDDRQMGDLREYVGAMNDLDAAETAAKTGTLAEKLAAAQDAKELRELVADSRNALAKSMKGFEKFGLEKKTNRAVFQKARLDAKVARPTAEKSVDAKPVETKARPKKSAVDVGKSEAVIAEYRKKNPVDTEGLARIRETERVNKEIALAEAREKLMNAFFSDDDSGFVEEPALKDKPTETPTKGVFDDYDKMTSAGSRLDAASPALPIARPEIPRATETNEEIRARRAEESRARLAAGIEEARTRSTPRPPAPIGRRAPESAWPSAMPAADNVPFDVGDWDEIPRYPTPPVRPDASRRLPFYDMAGMEDPEAYAPAPTRAEEPPLFDPTVRPAPRGIPALHETTFSPRAERPVADEPEEEEKPDIFTRMMDWKPGKWLKGLFGVGAVATTIGTGIKMHEDYSSAMDSSRSTTESARPEQAPVAPAANVEAGGSEMEAVAMTEPAAEAAPTAETQETAVTPAAVLEGLRSIPDSAATEGVTGKELAQALTENPKALEVAVKFAKLPKHKQTEMIRTLESQQDDLAANIAALRNAGSATLPREVSRAITVNSESFGRLQSIGDRARADLSMENGSWKSSELPKELKDSIQVNSKAFQKAKQNIETFKMIREWKAIK